MTQNPSALVEVENLRKNYGKFEAVRDVSFTVERGEVLGFLGPNGAGKSTTMRILTGYMPPTSGTARIAGFDVVEQSMEARRRVGYLPERTPLYLDMRARDYLNFMHELKRRDPARRKADVDAALERCLLTDVHNKLIANLSRGYRQRVGIAQAILGEPEVVILDEPTVGLDPAQVRAIRETIRNLAANSAVILSTHILPEVSMICGKVVIIHQGRIAVSARLDELREDAKTPSDLRLVARGDGPALEKAALAVPGALEVHREPARSADADNLWALSIRARKDIDARPRIAAALAAAPFELLEIRGSTPALETLFLEATSSK